MDLTQRNATQIDSPESSTGPEGEGKSYKRQNLG